MTNGRAYLDTWYLGLLLNDKKSDSLTAREIMNHLQGYDIIVPQIAVGEMVAVIMREFGTDPNIISIKMRTLANCMLNYIKPDICVPPVSLEILNHASTIMGMKIDGNDALILAHAINDPESEKFVTADPRILKNPTIYDYEEKLRSAEKRTRRLDITDSP